MNRALAIGAVLISVIALVISLRASPVQTPVAVLPDTPAPVDCVRRDELREIESRLFARVSSAERQVVAVRASALDAGLVLSAAVEGAPVVEGPPRYVRFETPSPALSVRQDSENSFAATNTDPTQTGKVVLVKAMQADGGSRTISLVVPAPGQ